MSTMVGIVVFCAMMWGCGETGPPNALDEASAPTVENLCKILQDTVLAQQDPDRVMNAIRSLGRRRAPEAIPDLVNLLGFRYWHDWEKKREGPRVVIRPLSVSSRYPAIEALVEIGKPALPALREVVEAREFNSVESRNARYAIRSIFRYEPSKADEFFKEAAARASSREAAERLTKALASAEEDAEGMKRSKEDL